MYLYVKTGVFKLIFRVLDIPKGLETGSHQRGRLWALNNEVFGLKNSACVCASLGMHMHACFLRTHASSETLILTTLMARLQTIITHSI